MPETAALQSRIYAAELDRAEKEAEGEAFFL
jgi:hypothetical protein